MKFSQKGFGVVEILLVLVIIGIIGGTGYYVYSAHQSKSETSQSSTISPTTAKKVESAPEIKTTKDLDTASTALDQSNGDSDLNEVNSLEKDVNNL